MSTVQPVIDLVVATRNLNKIKEIKAILGDKINYQILGSYIQINIKEVGETLFENSLIKAAFAFKVTNKPSLGEDAGLFIDALDGEPGIYSSRYGKNNNERINKVLEKLINVKKRSATFKVVFTFYYAPDKYETFEGKCSGKIAYEPRGSSGFGYDPIFIPRGYRKTFAELGPKIKNRISHRARALKKFKKYLTSSYPF